MARGEKSEKGGGSACVLVCVCVSEALEKLKLCDVHQNAKSQTNLRCGSDGSGSDAAERA